MQTDKTARAPLLQLVCVESLRRLGANDSQTDNPAGWAFPLHCATLYWSRCEWSSPHYESLSRVGEGTTELLPAFVEGLKCSWEESLHSTHGCTPVSPGHPKTSESTYNCQSSCPIAPICLPQAGISLHAHMLIQADSHTHSERCIRVMPWSACVGLLVLLSLSACLSAWRCLGYTAAALLWIASGLCFHVLFFRFILLYWKELKRGSSIASHAHFPTFFHSPSAWRQAWAGTVAAVYGWVVKLWATSPINWRIKRRKVLTLSESPNKGGTSTSICLRCIRLPYQQLRRVFPYWCFQITARGGDEMRTDGTSGQEFYPSPFGSSPQTTTEGIPQECPLVWAPPFTDFMQSVVVMGRPSFLMWCCECVYVMQNREKSPHKHS